MLKCPTCDSAVERPVLIAKCASITTKHEGARIMLPEAECLDAIMRNPGVRFDDLVTMLGRAESTVHVMLSHSSRVAERVGAHIINGQQKPCRYRLIVED